MPHECETCRYYREPWDGPHCIRCGWQELWEPADSADQDPGRQTPGSSGADSAAPPAREGRHLYAVMGTGTTPEEGRHIGEAEEMEAKA